MVPSSLLPNQWSVDLLDRINITSEELAPPLPQARSYSTPCRCQSFVMYVSINTPTPTRSIFPPSDVQIRKLLIQPSHVPTPAKATPSSILSHQVPSSSVLFRRVPPSTTIPFQQLPSRRIRRYQATLLPPRRDLAFFCRAGSLMRGEPPGIRQR